MDKLCEKQNPDHHAILKNPFLKPFRDILVNIFLDFNVVNDILCFRFACFQWDVDVSSACILKNSNFTVHNPEEKFAFIRVTPALPRSGGYRINLHIDKCNGWCDIFVGVANNRCTYSSKSIRFGKFARNDGYLITKLKEPRQGFLSISLDASKKILDFGSSFLDETLSYGHFDRGNTYFVVVLYQAEITFVSMESDPKSRYLKVLRY